jgi:hypothetical protein
MGARACVHIGVGFGVAFSGERQYQSQCSGTATVQSRFLFLQNAGMLPKSRFFVVL